MRTIGDPLRFAAEYVFDADIGGIWMYGDICLWCGGVRVGDYGKGTTLRDVLFMLDYVAHFSNNRANSRFRGLSGEELFSLLDWALYKTDPETRQDSYGISRRIPEDEQWIRHKVFPTAVVFSYWKGFLVEDDKFARLVFSRDPYSDVHEVLLNAGEVDAVLDQLRSELDNVYQREQANAM
jgi:hypothetical protein